MSLLRGLYRRYVALDIPGGIRNIDVWSAGVWAVTGGDGAAYAVEWYAMPWEDQDTAASSGSGSWGAVSQLLGRGKGNVLRGPVVQPLEWRAEASAAASEGAVGEQSRSAVLPPDATEWYKVGGRLCYCAFTEKRRSFTTAWYSNAAGG